MEVGGPPRKYNKNLHPSGQGVWYALTHRPDKILAAAPVSGYSSIQGGDPLSFPHRKH